MSSNLNVPVAVAAVTGYVERGPNLPRDYGVTRLVLLPRDPQWMHTYWEIAPYTWDEIEKNFGGVVRTQGRPILRLHSTRGSDKKIFDIGVELDARNWYVFSPLRGGSWIAEIGLMLPDGRFIVLARSNEIRLPLGYVSEILDERWGVLKGEWERLYALSGGGRLGAGSLDIARMLAQRWQFLKSISSWGASPGISSWAKRPEHGQKKFWLVADCELVVYGATEPDARVTVQGQTVQLNPDGTFSLRFSLPDGKLGIPIEAVNKDGDLSESIEFTINRKTQVPSPIVSAGASVNGKNVK